MCMTASGAKRRETDSTDGPRCSFTNDRPLPTLAGMRVRPMEEERSLSVSSALAASGRKQSFLQ